MPRYTITESVGNHVDRVHDFEDLHKHHPSSGRQPGRDYATIDGKLEEVRHQNGHTYIKKDFILSQDTPGPVSVPAPASGYIHYLHDETNAVRIYDKPFGTPGAVMQAQALHMVPGTSPPEGSMIQYGQPMGHMGDTGSPGSVHAHVETELGQFKHYIQDINDGTIHPEMASHHSSVQHGQAASSAASHGGLVQGDQGESVRHLQTSLARLGYVDAKGHPLGADGNFGPDTRHAVEKFQRDHALTVDGIAGPETLHKMDGLHHSKAHATPTGTLPGLDSPNHPQHALYLEAQKAVHGLDAHMGRESSQQSSNLAAALTVAAHRAGLAHIDQVALSEDGSRAFAVQNGAFKQTAQVSTAEAVNTPVAQSAQQLQQMTPKQPDPAQTQTLTPQQTANTMIV